MECSQNTSIGNASTWNTAAAIGIGSAYNEQIIRDWARARSQRAQAEKLAAEQLIVTFPYCHACGSGLSKTGNCPCGCIDNRIGDAIIANYHE